MKRTAPRLLIAGVFTTMTYATVSACGSNAYHQSLQFRDGKFHNAAAPQSARSGNFLAGLLRFMFEKPADAVPKQSIAVQRLTAADLQAAADGTLYRLGHSTLLLKLKGEFWLTDPVFSARASPVQWAGPKRFHEAPISIDELPPIKGVILSHDHYDHLDKAAIRQLAAKVDHFLAPLGVGDTLAEWGVDRAKIRQLDWWESTTVAGIQFVATPAQHFSGRGLFDRNRTLWASWVILSDDLRVFFSGDTGYFDGFKQIGERYGPFDITLLETGAYDRDWPDVHMQPEETLRAHLDLQGRWLLPVHNGTFDLALHAWHEPFERIVALAGTHGVSITTPRMGEAVNLRQPAPTERWWQQPAIAVAERGGLTLESSQTPSAARF